MTAAEKVRRDERVVADRVRGLSWPTIAQRHGLSERHCRTIWADQAPVLSVEDFDPLELVREAIAQYDGLLEDLALLAESASQDAVRLGALKSKVSVIGERLVFLQAVGLLPRDLGLLQQERDIRMIAHLLVDLFERYGLPPEAEEELLRALGASNGERSSNAAALGA
jgi:hypothetical protein